MSKPSQKFEFEQPETPAKIREGHIQDRGTDKRAGAPKAWRNRSTLTIAYEAGRLETSPAKGETKEQKEERQWQAMTRYEAGKIYSRHWDLSQSSGRNILDSDGVHTGGASGGLPETQAAAIHALRKINRHMSPNDAMIIALVCGKDESPAKAVTVVCGYGYEDAIAARFREALSSLVLAMGAARAERDVIQFDRP